MNTGMDDIIAAETVLSHVDGEAGRLIVRGHDIDDLAGKLRFEEMVALLWTDIVPPSQGPDLTRAIGEGRARAFDAFLPFHGALAGMEPVEAMRFLLASIPDEGPLAAPAALLGATGLAAAFAIRAASGQAAVAPDPERPHAADLLAMIHGHPADPAAADALDAYLVTVADHGLNASTFAGRVVASTRAGYVSTIVASLCALKGPLHGGAPGPVLDMLDAIGTAPQAEGWLAAALARGDRLMGFGHRVYRTRDPRADALKRTFVGLGADPARLKLAEAVEAAALGLLAGRAGARRLDVNVEFYTALLLDALRIPRQGFTAIFAAGRVAGWLAHAAEQQASGRLIRPQSLYAGPPPVRAA